MMNFARYAYFYGIIYEIINGVEVHQLDEGENQDLVKAFGRAPAIV